MEQFTDRDLFRVRLLFVDLIKSFFQAEPDAENFSRWRGTFSALTKEQINPLFDGAVRDLVRLLNEKTLTDIQTEYYELFTNPFGANQINTMASYHLDGRSFGQTLVSLRGLLAEAGIEREEGVVDSEDSLPMMLDIFSCLIEEEKHSGSDSVRNFQAKLLTEYLAPFASKFSSEVSKASKSDFYKSCCQLLCGYLDLEKGLVAVA